MKVKVIDFIEQGPENVLKFFTTTEGKATRANHIVDTIHIFDSERILNGPLPPKRFVQSDNCSRKKIFPLIY